jgi:hypothetical protein
MNEEHGEGAAARIAAKRLQQFFNGLGDYLYQGVPEYGLWKAKLFSKIAYNLINTEG